MQWTPRGYQKEGVGRRRGLSDIIISTDNMGGSQGRQYSVEDTVTLQHLTTRMDSDCNEAWGGLDNRGDAVTTMLLM